jgi:hypothetical protein
MMVAGLVQKVVKNKNYDSFLEKQICAHGAFEERSVFYYPKN